MENSNHTKDNMFKKPHAILVPLSLQGHLIPFVQLAIKLASKGFSITFITTESIHHQLTLSNPKTTNTTGCPSDIFAGSGLEDVEYVTVSDGLPVDYDRSLNHGRWEAANRYCWPAHVEVAVGKIVKSRPASVCCLIVDTYAVWGSHVAKKFALQFVSFWTEAALVLDIYLHVHLLKENRHIGPGARKDKIDYIPGIKSIKPTDLTSYLQEEDLTTPTQQYLFAVIEDVKKADFILGNTVQELETETISAINQAQKPFYAIGPLFPPGFKKSPIATNLWAESNCTQWLDTKAPGSVLYVSFGSYAHISKEELADIALGIKLSGVSFLWVLRPDMVSSDDPDPLPIGFKDEVRDRGIIITWTCQTTVLSHPAIGGFLTHCGWNSALESIWCEIPLLCFPLLTDQFTNRKLMVDDWKIGCTLCEEKPIRKEEVSQKIRLLMRDSMGSELKKNVKEIKQILQNAVTVKGSSEKNVDAFIRDLKLSIMKNH